MHGDYQEKTVRTQVTMSAETLVPHHAWSVWGSTWTCAQIARTDRYLKMACAGGGVYQRQFHITSFPKRRFPRLRGGRFMM
eukprot:282958-Rhodomonas_salina.1